MESSEENVPFLYLNKSKQSQKALKILEKSNKHFVTKEIKSQTGNYDLELPVLFAPQGVFKGLNAINAYAGSVFGKKAYP